MAIYSYRDYKTGDIKSYDRGIKRHSCPLPQLAPAQQMYDSLP